MRWLKLHGKDILVTTLAIACVILGVLLSRTQDKARSFTDGSRVGFKLEGTYQQDEPDYASLAIFPGAGDEVDWQLALSDNTISGTMEKTSDPNIYEMADDFGSECGIAHIAYSYASFGDVEGVVFFTWLVEMTMSSRRKATLRQCSIRDSERTGKSKQTAVLI